MISHPICCMQMLAASKWLFLPCQQCRAQNLPPTCFGQDLDFHELGGQIAWAEPSLMERVEG